MSFDMEGTNCNSVMAAWNQRVYSQMQEKDFCSTIRRGKDFHEISQNDWYLGLIGEDDKNGIRKRGYGDPLIIVEKLEASDVVLNEKSDGAHIGMGLQTQGKIRLRAGRVIADGNVLEKLTHRIFDARRAQA